jgi:hypothetical protein
MSSGSASERLLKAVHMDRFTVRIRAIGPLVGGVLFWSALASGCAAALLALVDIPAELSAQTILPSQVTPPTLRPPAASGGVITSPGTEDFLKVLPSPEKKKKKRSKALNYSNEATESPGVLREESRRTR